MATRQSSISSTSGIASVSPKCNLDSTKAANAKVQTPIYKYFRKCLVNNSPNATIVKQNSSPVSVLKGVESKTSLTMDGSVGHIKSNLETPNQSAESNFDIPFCKPNINLNEISKIAADFRNLKRRLNDSETDSSNSKPLEKKIGRPLRPSRREGNSMEILMQSGPAYNLIKQVTSHIMTTEFMDVTKIPSKNFRYKICHSGLSLGMDAAMSITLKEGLQNHTFVRNIFAKNAIRMKILENPEIEFEIYNPFSYQTFGSDPNDSFDEALKCYFEDPGNNLELSSRTTTKPSSHKQGKSYVSSKAGESIMDVIAIIDKQMRIICDSNTGKTYAIFPVPSQFDITDGSYVKLTMSSQLLPTENDSDDEDDSTLLSQVFQMKGMENVNFAMKAE